MTRCPHCGEPNVPDAAVCSHCGETLSDAPVPPPRLLAQIQGLIPAEPPISRGLAGAPLPPTEPPAPPPPPPPPPPGEAEAPEPEPEPPPSYVRPPLAAAPPRPSMLRLLLAAILLAAILAGLWLPPFTANEAPRRPDVDTAFTSLEHLPSRARVLLAWDYEPTTQGEMQLLAEPILLHLRQKRARLASVSLRPTGPSVAADAIAAAYERPLVANILIPPPVELGFLPGDAAALRALALAPVSAANLPELGAQALGLGPEDPLTAFDLVIEFSAETATTREWVEQITARQETPLIVAASGAVAPALRPYVQTGQIQALLAGYNDALAYESLLGMAAGRAASQRTAQTLAQAVLFAVALAALLWRRRP